MSNYSHPDVLHHTAIWMHPDDSEPDDDVDDDSSTGINVSTYGIEFPELTSHFAGFFSKQDEIITSNG